MPDSEAKRATDALQKSLRALMSEHGFKEHGRSFVRVFNDGIAQVFNIQMGPSDPPGTTYFPGLRENLYGLVTINLGVYVPEVAQFHHRYVPKNVREVDCCIRTRLGNVGQEVWWQLAELDNVTNNLKLRIRRDGFPWLDRFKDRDAILVELQNPERPFPNIVPPRIICAIICNSRGDKSKAQELFGLQAKETHNPGHPAYVKSLAASLGIPLDG